MSHISLLEAEENRDVIFATPCPQERGKRVKDFKPLHYATGPTPKSYLPFATPSTRRIDVATDIVAAMEEEKNDQGLKDIQGKQWKLFSVSPLFGYDPHSSPELLTNHLRNNKNLGNINVRLQSGLRGNREDAECLKVSVNSSKLMEFSNSNLKYIGPFFGFLYDPLLGHFRSTQSTLLFFRKTKINHVFHIHSCL